MDVVYHTGVDPEQKAKYLLASTDFYELIREMQDLSDQAGQGDEFSGKVLDCMLDACLDSNLWRKNNTACSATIHAVVRTRTPGSLMQVLNFVRRLPDSTPFGAVELISCLLPLYRTIVIGPCREMASSEDEAVRAVGIQTLCNLYLDGYFKSDEEVEHLESALKLYKQDRYFTGHLVDLVRSVLGKHKAERNESLEPDDFLVQLADG